MSDVVDLARKLARFDETWSPKVVAALNGQHVKLAKLEGEFVWHKHDAEDELFLVLEGELEMHLRDRVEVLRAGQLLVVPRGVEHKPVAHARVSVLLFEPATTLNTGDAEDARRVEAPEWL
ncbi:MAG: cupin domain-containing protein [Planctomycetes bacterium]|nr:cupin domain-containing protein [Planctomycetota bacterium]